MNQWDQRELRTCPTVDGRNPAPVEVGRLSMCIPFFTGFYSSQVVIARFLPSTVRTPQPFHCCTAGLPGEVLWTSCRGTFFFLKILQWIKTLLHVGDYTTHLGWGCKWAIKGSFSISWFMSLLLSFLRWKDGETGDQLVDANMRELKATGFMSNRGRQNVVTWRPKSWCPRQVASKLHCGWIFLLKWFGINKNWGRLCQDWKQEMIELTCHTFDFW